MDRDELKRGLDDYVGHLQRISQAFNEWAERKALPVRMDPTNAIAAVNAGIGLARIAPFWSRVDDSGIVHETQLKTAIDCLVQLRQSPKRCGHVLGAMQSGKTTTSLALQWAGPVLYLLTGQRAYPFYIIGNQTNHQDQTTTELDRFLAYYGNVEIHLTTPDSKRVPDMDAVFERSPSLANYREHVLRDARQYVYAVPQLEDIVHRRVGGDRSVRQIAEFCRRSTEQGYRPLMIIDEPQFGASDRIVPGDSGPIRRPCVLVQIFDRIEQEIGATREAHWFVGLSATPFELNDLEKVWEVRQYLSENYSGFNFFNQQEISEGVEVTPPVSMSLSRFADWVEVPFVADVSMAAYSGGPAAFARHARKVGYDGSQEDYRVDVEDALRESIHALLDEYAEDPMWPIGLCVRAFNDNAKTEGLIESLGLDSDRIEIIKYFGAESTGTSVKRAIAMRERRELPYVLFVTNRARMADAFPTEVRFFMDLAEKSSDLNALLQGLLGRACGYNKRSTVVLSDANAGIVDAYVATTGAYVHRTSRHSVAVGGFRRGAPTGMLKVRAEMDDAIVRRFFEEIDLQVVHPNIRNDSEKLRVPRARAVDGFRTGPILRIAQSLNLFDYIERPEVRAGLFPQIPSGFRVARPGDRIRHLREPGITLGYSLDVNGNCRYTFRWSDREAAAQGGAAGRAKGSKDSGQHMEPTIYVEKYDPTTGEVINDRNSQTKRPGNWRAFMVTFPLRDPVREVQPADVAYPIPLSPYNDWMEPYERETRDRGMRQQRRGQLPDE